MGKIVDWLLQKIVKIIVFINYSTKNTRKVKVIEKFLNRYSGVIIFKALTSIEIGSESQKSMINNVRNCDIFITFISPESVKSPITQQEIGIAIHLNKDIFPIILDKVNEKKDLGFLKGIQYITHSDTNLIPNLRKKIHTRYRKALIFWGVIIVFILYVLISNIANFISYF